MLVGGFQRRLMLIEIFEQAFGLILKVMMYCVFASSLLDTQSLLSFRSRVCILTSPVVFVQLIQPSPVWSKLPTKQLCLFFSMVFLNFYL